MSIRDGNEPKSGPAHQLFDKEGQPTRDRPWIFRTYAGHSSPQGVERAVPQRTWSKGQTGLSIAFDLPTQCGYDSDDAIARPEVGKVGVPINSLDDFHVLFDAIPLEQMNTSMTINGTAMWLLALYVALARERGVDTEAAAPAPRRTTSIKEYLARGTYIFPPEHEPADHRRDVRVLSRADAELERVEHLLATTCRRPARRRRRSWRSRWRTRSACSIC